VYLASNPVVLELISAQFPTRTALRASYNKRDVFLKCGKCTKLGKEENDKQKVQEITGS